MIDNIIETIERRGLTATIHQDPDADSPRNWDNLGHIVAIRNRRSYHMPCSLADDPSKAFDSGAEAALRLLYMNDGLGRNGRAYEVLSRAHDAGRDVDNLILAELHRELYAYAIYARSDSSLFMEDLAASDLEERSSLAGIIWVTKADGERECGSEYWIREALKGEVKALSDYFTGQVFGVVITGPEDQVLDSLWGIYGSEDYVRSQAEGMLDGVEKAIRSLKGTPTALFVGDVTIPIPALDAETNEAEWNALADSRIERAGFMRVSAWYHNATTGEIGAEVVRTAP